MSLLQLLLQADHTRSTPNLLKNSIRPPFLEFFAGSGLVSYALSPYFEEVWANDICPKKGAVFRANHKDSVFVLCSINDIDGHYLPMSVLSWASFPCQDLSLAGNAQGIRAKRSGLVWEWLRVMDEMKKRPPLLAAENVPGLVSVERGVHYKALHNALVDRNYRVGAVLLDAVHWLPQSRPRIFIIAIDSKVKIPKNLISDQPLWLHPPAIQTAANGLRNWIWWKLPKPEKRVMTLSGLIDFSLPCHDKFTSEKNIALIPVAHKEKLEKCNLRVVPGYKRIRNKKQVLELRFDDISGCLRTPCGGSSRQYLVLKTDHGWQTRILSPREAARLMGAPDTYKLPGGFNDGYKAMGDAVAAPVVSFLAKYLLYPLAKCCDEIA